MLLDPHALISAKLNDGQLEDMFVIDLVGLVVVVVVLVIGLWEKEVLHDLAIMP